jgi:ADP-heptose:LPS heptosyltransferase
MNTRRQIAIDKYIARPLAALLNIAVRIAGKILSIDHNLDKDFQTIAVCKFKGMGSIIQSTPLLKALRQKYPTATIIFVSTEANRALLEKIELIDEVVTVNDSSLSQLLSTNIRALSRLIRLRPGVYLDLEIYSNYSVIFTALSLSINRLGFYLRSSSFRMGIYTHMMYYNPAMPISRVYLQLGALLGCDTDHESLYPFSGQIPQSLKRGQYIVINPNASDLRLERRWNPERFVGIAKKLLELNPEWTLVFVGSKAERTYTEGIVGEINSTRVINLAGRTSLEELIGCIDGARLMITNDTGPMHIAFATKTPVVCLFGPCSPAQYGVHEKAYIVYRKVYCSPCVHDFTIPPCKGNNTCMQLIEEAAVMAQIDGALRGEDPIPTESTTAYLHKDNVLGKVIR